MALAYTKHSRRPGERSTGRRAPTPAPNADPGIRTGRSHVRRTVVVGLIAGLAAAAGIAVLVGAPAVAAGCLTVSLMVASSAFLLLFWRLWERDPRGHSGGAAGLVGPAGCWPYGGGAVAIGFVDPDTVPVPPPVPADHPHRTGPPDWAR